MVFLFENRKCVLYIRYVESYMEVCIDGNITVDEIRFIWDKIIQECEKYDCRKILIISDLKAFEMSHAVTFRTLINELSSPLDYKIAWIENNAENRKMIKLIQDLAIREGLKNIIHFHKKGFAIRWLTD